MRRYAIFFVMILLIPLGLSPLYAHSPQAIPENAFFADQLPAGADIFIGIRTDETYFDQLDDIVTTILNGFNTIFPHMLDDIGEARLYTLLERQLFFLGSFQADIRPWLGDKIGVGVYWGETAPQQTLIIIDHTNREQTESYVNDLTGGSIASSIQGNFTVYGEDEPLILAVNDEALYIATTSELLPINGSPTDNMANDVQFQTALATLPSPNYNLIAMGQTQYVAYLLNNPTLIQLTQGLADTYTAIGATIQADMSLTVDIAQIGLDGISTYFGTPISPDFAQHIPINTTGFIHGANFVPIINTLLSALSASGQAPTPNDLNVLNTLAGVDLADVFLSGDFALYFGYYPENWMAYSLEQLETRGQMPSGELDDFFDFGAIFAHNNYDEAKQFMDNIGTILAIYPTLKIERTIIGEADVIIITIPDNDGGLPEMDVYIGITDSLLTIGTRNSTLAILAGEAGLMNHTSYQTSSQSILPNATHYWFTNGDIITIFFNFVLLWLVPPPQDPLSDFDYYEGIFTSIRDYQPNLIQFADLFDSTSITTSINDDTLFIRAVITLTQE